MIRRPPRSTQSRSSAASDVYKRQVYEILIDFVGRILGQNPALFASIQMNADRSVREAFLTQCAALVEIINANDSAAFIATMKRAAKHFGDAEPVSYTHLTLPTIYSV